MRKVSLTGRFFESDLSETIDHHLMEIYQIDLPTLNALKIFRPTEYRKMRDEEVGFQQRYRI